MNGQREQVFVYGTLRRGGSNGHRMAAARLVGAATVRGRLLRVAWYPGLVLDPAAGPVRGEVFEVGDGLLAELDLFEGCDPATGSGDEYRRVRHPVRLVGGRPTRAWMWEWVGATAGLETIAGGDWLG